MFNNRKVSNNNSMDKTGALAQEGVDTVINKLIQGYGASITRNFYSLPKTDRSFQNHRFLSEKPFW